MARETFNRIGDATYRLVATVDEGQSLYMTAGRRIAVEKYDMRIGGTEFDFQVTSRGVRDGSPEAIASTRRGEEREFLENRTKSNLYGMPVSLGNAWQMASQRRFDLTYGEIRPQVFRSAVRTDPVAWRIWFNRTWYSGQASGRGFRASPNAGPNARVTARNSARINATSAGPRRGPASTRIGPLRNDAGILRVWVPVDDDYAFVGAFDRHDMIFRPLTFGERLGGLLRGEGW